ncbi:NUDIX hydrolase [Streptomyces anulatus]|uniref:NUDIX hydrolase n=1 Tax=Streptomyces anulatus TaxID=1892 RepID=UPI002E1276EF|nr:NUDIX hydrolase [Streptomyces anulatus]
MTRSEPDVRAEQEALFSTAAEHYARHRPGLPAVLFEAFPAAYVCLYVTDENDRPLQLHSVYSPGHPWHMIGGAMDLGERPWDAVVRECREETGMRAVGPPRLLATVFGVPRAQRPYSTLQLIFDGGRLTAEEIRGITLNPREHDEARVLSLAEWEALMPARDFVRLRAVEEARRTGVAAYSDTWGNA